MLELVNIRIYINLLLVTIFLILGIKNSKIKSDWLEGENMKNVDKLE